MKETFDKIYTMGLGAMEVTSKKASSLKKEFLEAGEKMYNDAESMSDDVKTNLMDNAKKKIIREMTKEDIVSKIESLDDKDREEILKLLKKKNKKG